jgi:hypothetical protein
VTAVPGGVARAQAALAFIRAARERPELRQQLAGLDPADGLGPVVSLAVAAGFDIEAESLRVAYAYDWALRRARYRPPAEAAPSAASTVAVVKQASSST